MDLVLKIEYFRYFPPFASFLLFFSQFAVRFNEQQKGFFFLFFHNCFNYREHGYSDRVAVDLAVISVGKKENN